jgi:diguanylate cyclase (GGDEF)-like protein
MAPDEHAETSPTRSPGSDLSRRALVVYARLLRSIIDGVGEALLVVDDQGTILLRNSAFDELAQLPGASQSEKTDVRAVFAALGAGLDEAGLQALFASQATSTTIELAGDRTVLCSVRVLTLDAPDDCRLLAFRETTLERRELEELEHRAFHDPLTALPNRDLLLDRLDLAMSRQAREGGGVGVVFIDLDGFKEVNDRHGHGAGDRVLIEVGRRLQLELRDADSVGRIGGDEFVVVCDGIESEAALTNICARIQGGLEAPFRLERGVVMLTTSLGAVLEWWHDADPGGLIDRADGLMYTAKRTGSRREIAVQGRPIEASRRAQGARALREAVEKGGLWLGCLPVVALDSGRATAVEGLLRCRHPELSDRSPQQLLELIAHTRLLNRFDEWLLGEAAQVSRVLLNAIGTRLPVAVNLSQAQLADSALAPKLLEIADAQGIGPSALSFDIPHAVIVANPSWLEPAIASLRDLNCELFVDDVVGQEADIERLSELGIAGMKLDGSTIQLSADDAEAASALRSSVALARSLGLSVVAEGVDNEWRLQTARELGCDSAQGYGFFGFPKPAAEIARLIA